MGQVGLASARDFFHWGSLFQCRRRTAASDPVVFISCLIAIEWCAQTSAKLYLVLDFMNGGHLFFNLYRQGIFDEPQVSCRIRFLVALACTSIVLLSLL